MGSDAPIERLYLCKEREKDVFVEKGNIYDYQIDGLRFLWRQFKKKNPGVILNFPPHSGKSVTILLFLYAIRKLLQQPVLILCRDETQVEEWHQCLKQWTGFTDDDVIVEPTKALLKKQIFIKSMSEIVSFTKRSWSILVYKDDEYIGLPQFTDVDLYIWATSTDVVKDLNFLSNIYHWMCPKANVKFDMGNGDLKKHILLDALLEDIVLRRNRITVEKQTTIEECTPAKRSKKNKDITGTKIKRTKVSTNAICEQPTIDFKQNNDFQMDENYEVKKNIVKTKELPVPNELHKETRDESTDGFDVNEFKIDGDTQTETCILHYDETPSDIGSPVGDSSKFGSNNYIKADNVGLVSNNEDTTNNNDLKPESSINMNFKDNNEILGVDNSSDKLKTIVANEVSTVIKQNEVMRIENEEKSNKQSENIAIEKNIDDSTNQSIVKDGDDLDSKIIEMEERAMKKFKGSFLDSIF